MGLLSFGEDATAWPPSASPLEEEAHLSTVNSASDVDALVRKVFGHPLTTTGLLHTVAVYRPRPGTFRVLRITPETPRSAYDQFSLMVSRARADAILTSGRNLRLEPTGTHVLSGPGTLPSALAAWRRERLGRTSPPHLLVLTRGDDLDLDHPALKIAARVFIFTGEEAAFALESRAADHGIEVVGVPSLLHPRRSTSCAASWARRPSASKLDLRWRGSFTTR